MRKFAAIILALTLCLCLQAQVFATEPPCTHANRETKNALEATCTEAGYSGDTYCLDCGQLLHIGAPILATGVHKFSDWVETDTLRCRACSVCNFEEVEYFDDSTVATKPAPKPVMPMGDTGWLNILLVSVLVATFLGAAIYIVKGKRK